MTIDQNNPNRKLHIKHNQTFDLNPVNQNEQNKASEKDFLSIDRNNQMKENFKKKATTK